MLRGKLPRRTSSPRRIRPVAACQPALSQSAVFAIKARDFACGLALDSALLQIRALIPRYFALGNTELGLQLAVFPVELENDQSAPGDLRFAVKLVDLLSMQQKFSHALGRRDFVACLC